MAYQQSDVRLVWQLIHETATKDPERLLGQEALKLLAQWQTEEPATWELIRESAAKDPSQYVRGEALRLLSK
jgi:hypothetical protein